MASIIYGWLAEKGARYAVESGTAHAASTMTTPGDNSMAILQKIESLIRGETAIVKR